MPLVSVAQQKYLALVAAGRPAAIVFWGDQLTDPWAALDPHDPGTSQGLPIRKGRTYKLPPQLRKRRGSKKAQEGVGTGGGGEERKDAGGSWVGHDGKLT